VASLVQRIDYVWNFVVGPPVFMGGEVIPEVVEEFALGTWNVVEDGRHDLRPASALHGAAGLRCAGQRFERCGESLADFFDRTIRTVFAAVSMIRLGDGALAVDQRPHGVKENCLGLPVALAHGRLLGRSFDGDEYLEGAGGSLEAVWL